MLGLADAFTTSFSSLVICGEYTDSGSDPGTGDGVSGSIGLSLDGIWSICGEFSGVLSILRSIPNSSIAARCISRLALLFHGAYPS